MKKSFGAKTLVFPTPVWVVCTYDREGRPNAMSAAWGGICCSQPPCLAVSLRKATYTYGNIVARKAFTINVPSEIHARQADYFGMVSGKNVDKFSAAELTPIRSSIVDAPFIEEFPLVVECRLLHSIEIGLHTQFVGEILDVKAEDSVFDEKGYVDIEKVRPILFEPEINTYHGVGKLLGRAFSMGKEIRGKSPR
ncbi:flavin reductase family protein [Candidatus Deferrimicrobium sp.]|uniref:flavin reductase family protein n=1 Tax=Candidatus Deferrimicrobium sp. TaxID=3060586 RepID=UPI003C6977BB